MTGMCTSRWIPVRPGSSRPAVRSNGFYNYEVEKNAVGTEWPNVLPGGGGLIFRLRRLGECRRTFSIMAMKLPNGPARALTRGIAARYSPTGHLLVVTSDGKLVAIPFDPDKLELTGPPVAVIEGVGIRTGGFNVDLSFSDDWQPGLRPGRTIGDRRAAWVSRDGKAEPMDIGWDPQGRRSKVCPCRRMGKALAVSLNRNGKLATSWSSSCRPALFCGSPSTIPRASGPAGAVARREKRCTTCGIVTERPSAGCSRTRRTARVERGRWRTRSASWPRRHRRGTDDGSSPAPPSATYELRHPREANGGHRVGPVDRHFRDGGIPGRSLATERWLAYQSSESGTSQVYVRPFPETASAKWQVSTSAAPNPSGLGMAGSSSTSTATTRWS